MVFSYVCKYLNLLEGRVIAICQHEIQQYILLICKKFSFDYLLASCCIIFQPNHFPQFVNTITKELVRETCTIFEMSCL